MSGGGFPGRKTSLRVPWKLIAVSVLVVVVFVFSVYRHVKRALNTPQAKIVAQHSTNSNHKKTYEVPEAGIGLAQKTEDNVKQFLSGRLGEKPKDRNVPKKYAFANRSSSNGDYYSDR